MPEKKVAAEETPKEPEEQQPNRNEEADGGGPEEAAENEGGKDKSETNKSGRNYGPQHAVAVLLPVSICIWLVILIVMTTFVKDTIGVQQTRLMSKWNVMSESASRSTGDNIWRAIINGLIILGVIVVMTCAMLALYYFKLYKILWGFLGFSICIGLTMQTYFVARKIFKAHGWSVSLPTFLLLALNWAVLGGMAVFWKAAFRVQQVAMVYLACMMSLMLQLLLPPWTGWMVLGLLVAWDLIAVLTPCGPLKKFVELAQERDERGNGPLAALVYTSGMAYFEELEDHRLEGGKEEETIKLNPIKSEEKAGGKEEGQPEEQEVVDVETDEKEDEENRGIQLGLGDFVFYSILTGKTAETGSWTTVIACYVAIIGGLLATLFLLISSKKALPALPISLTFGIIFYFAGEHAILPYLTELQKNQMVI